MQLQVNQKMILTLTASIMYWSLQQSVEESESSPSPAATAATPDESPAPSVISEDESTLGGEFSNLTIDDAASDTTVSSQLENEDAPLASDNRTSSQVEDKDNSINRDSPIVSDVVVSSQVEDKDNSINVDTPIISDAVISSQVEDKNNSFTSDTESSPHIENGDTTVKEQTA